jgi:hypothetical protein
VSYTSLVVPYLRILFLRSSIELELELGSTAEHVVRFGLTTVTEICIGTP